MYFFGPAVKALVAILKKISENILLGKNPKWKNISKDFTVLRVGRPPALVFHHQVSNSKLGQK